MEWLILLTIFVTFMIALRGSLWDKLLSLSSMGIKISIFILIVSWKMKLPYLVDIALLLLMVGSAGVALIFLLIMRSGLE